MVLKIVPSISFCPLLSPPGGRLHLYLPEEPFEEVCDNLRPEDASLWIPLWRFSSRKPTGERDSMRCDAASVGNPQGSTSSEEDAGAPLLGGDGAPWLDAHPAQRVASP